ncbi:MAG: stage V sporulation protein AC [Oscillospiraceae bacterium]|nr:stage V sporulation protein AC [Oscillospiraceae bacterium]
MKTSKKEYDKMVKQASPKSPKAKDFIWAFVVGGFICVIGQLLSEYYTSLEMPKEDSAAAVSTTLIFIAAILTGIGVFDGIAKFAGAGTLVPITGFANSIVSPAIEYKNEGQILGLGAKMFTIAGPVLVYGITASAIYGLILWIISII